MLKIKAKIKISLRIFGFLLIFLGIIISIILDFIIFNNAIYFLYLLITIPFLIFIILTKVENDLFNYNEEIYLIIYVIISSFFFIAGVIIINQSETIFLFLISIISNYLFIICWNYSLSIYKKEKILSLINGIGYCLLTSIFKYKIVIQTLNIVFNFISIFLLIIGFLIISIIEIIMKKKKMLRWL